MFASEEGQLAIRTTLQFLLLGLGSGAVYGAIGLGLVLTYRASGVVNFAHGAVAMYATYVYVGLRSAGELVLPLPGAPGRIHLASHLSAPAAAAVAVVVAGVLGLVFHLLVFRPLRHAPAMARVVASVGLMVALQAVVTLQFGSDSLPVPSLLPARPMHLLGVSVPRDRLILAGLVAVAGAVLWAVYRFTPFGLASRAVAENETALALVGWSPNMVAGVNWVLASVLAGLSGILVGPITAVDPLSFTLLVVPALAVALVGGLSSFGITVAAGLGLGMLQSELVQAQSHVSWLPATGLAAALPLVIIVATAIARGSLVPTRAEVVERLLPEVGRPRRPLPLAAGGFAAGAVALALLHGQYRLGAVNSLIGAVVALSIVVLTGYLSQLSLAQMAFAGVGGYALSRLDRSLGVPFPFDAVLAAGLAAVAGLAIGLPALRVRGASLATATLAGALAVESLLFTNPALTGGFAGSRVNPPSFAGIDLAAAGRSATDYPRYPFALVVLAVVCVTGYAVARLRVGPWGRRLLAVRANERAAEAIGIGLTRTKLVGFAASAFVAGLAGALLGYEQGQISFGSFGVLISLSYLAVTYIGGIGRVAGALVGGSLVASGIVFTVLEQPAGLGRYQLLVSGLAVVVAAVVLPDGLSGGAARAARGAATRFRRWTNRTPA